MIDLIERLEKATGESRELDFAIHDWLYPSERQPTPLRKGESYPPADFGGGGGAFSQAMDPRPRYTGSTDAALGLVPEGMVAAVTTEGDALVSKPRDHWTDDLGMGFCQRGSTPAIAICLAALKARAAMQVGQALAASESEA